MTSAKACLDVLPGIWYLTYAALWGRSECLSECLGEALTSLNEDEELAPLSRVLAPRWKFRVLSSP